MSNQLQKIFFLTALLLSSILTAPSTSLSELGSVLHRRVKIAPYLAPEIKKKFKPGHYLRKDGILPWTPSPA